MDFEKLGAFYLGKGYDMSTGKLQDRLVMYDARDLTTHAVCVGMTGSGKTGLCIDLLEEAAIDHVPALIIDPKGDMTNLLLTFPELHSGDFKPWVNADDALRKGLSVDDFAAQQADMWQKGLAEWGQDASRIKMLRESADFTIYTPGSDSGVPVSILHSLAAPGLDWSTESELLRERIAGTVSALLGLIGVEADPVRSREHILMANIFEHFWRQGEDLDLKKLILSIQNPPMRELGVFDTDTFFPQKDRLTLAMSLNNIIASPGFQSWLHGQPLDIPGFLATPAGKPRHSIFYIAHLSDAERMFFVTILLNQVITWVRAQPGTTSLRALLYMDEIFGFFPPVANPPSKRPMLTLLKQARAFGLGVVLTTQNPVDLDYKGLTNAGTWFIGRLQTERDKLRVLDGLEGASSEAGKTLDREALSTIISNLQKRTFLLHSVHEEAPIIFQSRWAMSYLRGPLTRTQIHDLMGKKTPDLQPEPVTTAKLAAPVSAVREGAGFAQSPPILSPSIQQVYLPVRKRAQTASLEVQSRGGADTRSQLVYEPAALGMGVVHFADERRRVDERDTFAFLVQIPESGIMQWEQTQSITLKPQELLNRPEPDGFFDFIPDSTKKGLSSLEKDVTDYLARTSSLTLLYNAALKTYSKPNESERDFIMRLTQVAREKRDEEVDKLNQQYEKRLQTLEDRLRRAEASQAKKQADAAAHKREIAVSVGESVLGMFMGRRSTRAASSAFSKYRQSKEASMGAKEAEESVQVLQQEIKQLETELKEQAAAITARWDSVLTDIEQVPIKPRRSDIQVNVAALAWTPHWQVTYKDAKGTQTEMVPAY